MQPAIPALQILNREPRLVHFSQLEPYPGNARRHNDESIKESLRTLGFWGFLTVQRRENGALRILAGNGRFRNARELGYESFPVVEVDVDDETARRINLADNKTSDDATNDPEALLALLEQLRETDLGFTGTGYDEPDYEALLREVRSGRTPGDPEEEDEAPVALKDQLQQKWQTATGQIWAIGPHRLAIGDAQDRDLVLRLCGEESPHCMWTDPPYGVDYTGKTKDALKIQGDTKEGLRQLLSAAFAAADAVLRDGAPIYVAHADMERVVFEGAFRNVGLGEKGQPAWHLHEFLVWVKNAMVLGHNDYHWQHEPILYGWKGKNRRWYGGRDQKTVFTVDKPPASEEHPTMKPVELVRRMIENSTQPTHVVLDPFGGSGTTMVAAASIERVAYLVEVDPGYAAVILERMSRLGHAPEALG